VPNLITRRAEEDSDIAEERELDAIDRMDGMTDAEIAENKADEHEEFMTRLMDKAHRGEMDDVLPVRCHVGMHRRKLHPKAGWPYRYRDEPGEE
jgi:predicted RecB family endonuclease